jgi:hypothetical protein
MKSLPASLLLVLLVSTGCGQFGLWHHSVVKGSGTIVTEERSVAEFDHVSVGGSGHLTIVQGDQEALTITADDNLLEMIESSVSGQRLRIGPANVSLRPTQQILYTLHVKDLRQLDLSGSLSAVIDALTTESITLRISGSGKIEIPQLATRQCDSQISGSGRVELAGEADSLRLHVSGSGDYLAGDLLSKMAEIRISGSGDATLWVSERLDASISGSGTVSYFGNPSTSQSVSGSGKIRSLGTKERTGLLRSPNSAETTAEPGHAQVAR